MSLQLVIPRRVALQQSSPPLHQPSVILKEKRKFEKEKPLNGKCANTKLSQRRGSPHGTVPNFVPTQPLDRCQNSILRRMDVARRNPDGTVSSDASERPRVAATLAKPGEKRVAERIQHERAHLAQRQCLAVLLF